MEYCLDNGTLSVRVSSLGGELQSVKKDGKEYLWQGDPAYWDGKAPNLFPYIARLTKETCTVHGKASGSAKSCCKSFCRFIFGNF